jgi:hypothetical protein
MTATIRPAGSRARGMRPAVSEHVAFDFGMRLDGTHVEHWQCRTCITDWPCLTAQLAAAQATIAELTARVEYEAMRADAAEAMVTASGQRNIRLMDSSRDQLAARDAEVAELKAALAAHRSAMAAVLHPMMDGSEREAIKKLLAKPALVGRTPAPAGGEGE